MNILLDYFFPITAINPTPAASTAFLKQACVVVRPKVAVPTGVITLCTSMTAVAALTDNTEAQQLFNAGMNRVYILPMDDLDLEAALEGHESDFFTLLISSDFDKDDIEIAAASITKGDLTFEAVETGWGGNEITVAFVDTGTAGSESVTVTGTDIVVSMEAGVSTATQLKTALDADEEAAALITTAIASGQGAVAQAAFAEDALEGGAGLFAGAFTGVIGVSETDDAFLADQAAVEKRAAFHTTTGNKAKNMFFAFGKLLSNALNWVNQQYISMPFADDVDTLGEANALFDDKISMVISDSEFGERLALFACGGKAIVAPYITRNLELDLQSKALQYISGNQPQYTRKAAALLEDELQKVVDSYIERQWIEAGVIEVKLEQDNFVASGYINISEPKALWRIFGEIRQTL
jgi:hypothetical protein